MPEELSSWMIQRVSAAKPETTCREIAELSAEETLRQLATEMYPGGKKGQEVASCRLLHLPQTHDP